MSIKCILEHLGDDFKKMFSDNDIPDDVADGFIKKIIDGEDINKEIDELFNKKKQASQDIINRGKSLHKQVLQQPGITAKVLNGVLQRDDKAIKKVSNVIKNMLDSIGYAIEGEGYQQQKKIKDNIFNTKDSDLSIDELGNIWDRLFLNKNNYNKLTPAEKQLDKDIGAVYNKVMEYKDAGKDMTLEDLLKITDNKYAHHIGTELANSKHIADAIKKRADSSQYTGHLTYEQVKAGMIESDFISLVNKNTDWEHESMLNKFNKYDDFRKEIKDNQKQYQVKNDEYAKQLHEENIAPLQQQIDELNSNLKNNVNTDDIKKQIDTLNKQLEKNKITNKTLLDNYINRNHVSMTTDKITISEKYRERYTKDIYKAIKEDYTGSLKNKKKWDFENNVRESSVEDDIQRSFVFKDYNSAYEFHKSVGNNNSATLNIFNGIVNQHKSNVKRQYFGDNPISVIEKMFANFSDENHKIDANTFKVSTDGVLFTDKYNTGLSTLINGPQLGDSLNHMFGAYSGSAYGNNYSSKIMSKGLDTLTNIAGFKMLAYYPVKSLSDAVVKNFNQYAIGSKSGLMASLGAGIDATRVLVQLPIDTALILSSNIAGRFNKNIAESLASKTSAGKLLKRGLLDISQSVDLVTKMKNIHSDAFKDVYSELSKETSGVIDKIKTGTLKVASASKTIAEWLHMLSRVGRGQLSDIDIKKSMAESGISNHISNMVLGTTDNNFTKILQRKHGWNNETKKMLSDYGFDENVFKIEEFGALHTQDLLKKSEILSKVEKEMKSLNEDLYNARTNNNKVADWQEKLLTGTDEGKALSLQEQIDEMLPKLKSIDEIKKMDTDLQQIKKNYDIKKADFENHKQQGANVKSLYWSELARMQNEPGNSVKGALTRGLNPNSIEYKFQNAIMQFQSYTYQLLENISENRAIYEEVGNQSAMLQVATITFASMVAYEILGADLANRAWNLTHPDAKKKRTVINKDMTAEEWAKHISIGIVRVIPHPGINAGVTAGINLTGINEGKTSNLTPAESIVKDFFRTAKKIRKGEGLDVVKEMPMDTAKLISPPIHLILSQLFNQEK